MSIPTATAHEVVVKAVEPVRVVSVRGVVPDLEQLGDKFDELFGILGAYIENNGEAVGSPMAAYLDAGTGPRMLDMHVELLIPFEGAAGGNEQVTVYELPRVEQMACLIHKGPFEAIGSAYNELFAWVAENGYRPAGPMRDVYLSCGEGDSENYITEVQVPVTR